MFYFALQQTINNLEGCISFASAGCHNKQNAVLPFGNSVKSSVYGNTLVIARRISCLAAVIGLLYKCFLFSIYICFLFIAGN